MMGSEKSTAFEAINATAKTQEEERQQEQKNVTTNSRVIEEFSIEINRTNEAGFDEPSSDENRVRLSGNSNNYNEDQIASEGSINEIHKLVANVPHQVKKSCVASTLTTTDTLDLSKPLATAAPKTSAPSHLSINDMIASSATTITAATVAATTAEAPVATFVANHTANSIPSSDNTSQSHPGKKRKFEMLSTTGTTIIPPPPSGHNSNNMNNVNSTMSHASSNASRSGPVTPPLVEYPIVFQTVNDIFGLLQTYGPLTYAQLEYNLPPLINNSSNHHNRMFNHHSLFDILELLVAIGLVQKVQEPPPTNEIPQNCKNTHPDDESERTGTKIDDNIDQDDVGSSETITTQASSSIPPTLSTTTTTTRYCMLQGIPRADVVHPCTVLDQIEAAHDEIKHCQERIEKLEQVLLSMGSSSSSTNKTLSSSLSTSSHRDVLKSLVSDYPEVLQDPVYVAALRNLHIDIGGGSGGGTSSGERERKRGTMSSKGGTNSVSSATASSSTMPAAAAAAVAVSRTKVTPPSVRTTTMGVVTTPSTSTEVTDVDHRKTNLVTTHEMASVAATSTTTTSVTTITAPTILDRSGTLVDDTAIKDDSNNQNEGLPTDEKRMKQCQDNVTEMVTLSVLPPSDDTSS